MIKDAWIKCYLYEYSLSANKKKVVKNVSKSFIFNQKIYKIIYQHVTCNIVVKIMILE